MKRRLTKTKKALRADPGQVLRHVTWPEERVSGGVSHAPFAYVQPYVGYPPMKSEEGVKVVSWNVNGLQRLLKTDVNVVSQLALREHPQLLCLQKTKLQAPCDQLDALLPRYTPHYAFSARRGHSGVAVYVHSSVDVEQVVPGLPGAPEFSREGRVLTVVTPKVIYVNVAAPPSRSQARLQARLDTWEPALRNYVARLKDLEGHREVCVVGDMNVAHMPLDAEAGSGPASAAEWARGADERAAFSELLSSQQLTDTFRSRKPNDQRWYSYWPNDLASRQRNVGRRLDYALATPGILKGLVHSSILNAYHGSDHCPIACSFRTTHL